MLIVSSSNIVTSSLPPQHDSIKKDDLETYVNDRTAMLFGKNSGLDEVNQFAHQTKNKIFNNNPYSNYFSKKLVNQTIRDESVSFILDQIEKNKGNNTRKAEELNNAILQLSTGQSMDDPPYGIFASYVGESLKRKLATLYSQQTEQHSQKNTGLLAFFNRLLNGN